MIQRVLTKDGCPSTNEGNLLPEGKEDYIYKSLFKLNEVGNLKLQQQNLTE